MTIIPRSVSEYLDSELLPRQVGKFLQATGWEIRRQQSGLLEIWGDPDSNASLMLPLDPSFRDYEERLGDALRVLMDVNEIAPSNLGLEIASASSDILLLRADQFTSDGSIPLREAERLIQSARKLVTAAALSAVSPKPNFGSGRRPSTVQSFVDDDLRMGHTQHGSFIITILARLDEAEPEATSGRPGHPDKSAIAPASSESGYEQWEPEGVSFGRRVMTTLSTGLAAAHEYLENSNLDLDDAVGRGVSAELMDSIADLSGLEGVRSVDTRFKWSPLHERPPVVGLESIKLKPAYAERAGKARDRLRKRPSLDSDQIIGPVVRLERDEGEPQGVAIVDGYVGKQRRRLRIELAPREYAIATEAHNGREPVLAEGAITFSRNAYWMRTPSQFVKVSDLNRTP